MWKVILIIGRIMCKLIFFKIKIYSVNNKIIWFLFFLYGCERCELYRFNNLCSWFFLVFVLDLNNFIKLMYL